MVTRIFRIVTAILDMIESTFLLAVAFIASPYGLLREAANWKGFALLSYTLIPEGMLADALRANIHMKYGSGERAAHYLESAIIALEEIINKNDEFSKNHVRICCYFYRLLTQHYLSSGKIDDAMQAVIRAQRNLGVDHIQGLAEIDMKTATIVRAGLAAGRLMEQGGLTNPIVIETDDLDEDLFSRKLAQRLKNKKSGSRSNKSKKELDSDKEGPLATIIPFPLTPQPQ